MTLENISRKEHLIKEAFEQWTNKISEDYLKNNDIAMNAKMYLKLNRLYLKNKGNKRVN
jgi:hypothetical protein